MVRKGTRAIGVLGLAMLASVAVGCKTKVSSKRSGPADAGSRAERNQGNAQRGGMLYLNFNALGLQGAEAVDVEDASVVLNCGGVETLVNFNGMTDVSHMLPAEGCSVQVQSMTVRMEDGSGSSEALYTVASEPASWTTGSINKFTAAGQSDLWLHVKVTVPGEMDLSHDYPLVYELTHQASIASVSNQGVTSGTGNVASSFNMLAPGMDLSPISGSVAISASAISFDFECAAAVWEQLWLEYGGRCNGWGLASELVFEAARDENSIVIVSTKELTPEEWMSRAKESTAYFETLTPAYNGSGAFTLTLIPSDVEDTQGIEDDEGVTTNTFVETSDQNQALFVHLVPKKISPEEFGQASIVRIQGVKLVR